MDVPGHNPRRCESPPGSATAQLLDRGSWRKRLDASSNQPTPGEALEEREAAERFYRVLDDLPEHYRQVLVLFELEEMTTEEIARTVDRPAATVRVWLHRARAQFTKRWLHDRRQQEGTR